MKIDIRPERVSDYFPVADMYFQAFADVFGPAEFVSEVVLVDLYRHAPTFDPELSLVAEIDGRVVGHVLFFPHDMVLGGGSVKAAFLAIVGVLPRWQKCGIGGRLIERGLDIAREKGCDISLVLGHVKYYTRFGYHTDMFGECWLEVGKEQLGGGEELEAAPVRTGHVAALQAMWREWHGSTDLAIIPGNSIVDWATYAKHVAASVFLRRGKVVGYARYDQGKPQQPGCVLAASSEDAKAVLDWLLSRQEAGKEQLIKVPVHPDSTVARQWLTGSGHSRPWDVSMLVVLNPACKEAKAYINEVKTKKRTIGLMMWPALLTSVE